MLVDDALIEKLSRLSMLSFNESEKEQIKTDLQKMIAFVDQLKEIDTTGVEPLLHLSPAVNVLRDDVPGPMLTAAEALQSAAHHNESFFLVPKVIKKDGA